MIVMSQQQGLFRCLHRFVPRIMAGMDHSDRRIGAKSRTSGGQAQSSNIHSLPIGISAPRARKDLAPADAARTRPTPESGFSKGQPRRRFSTIFATPREMEGKPQNPLARVKHRIPQKRASALMSELRQEAKDDPPLEIPDIVSGDAVEIKISDFKSTKRYNVYRGVCIRRVNKGNDTTVLLRDIVYDIDLEHNIPLYSPLIQSMEILEKRFINQGKKKGKRVRQARIYYIKGLNDKFSRITGSRGY